MSLQTNCMIASRNWTDEDAPSATSTSSITVGTGSKSFTVANTTRFWNGATITATGSSSANVMSGTITAFSPTTGTGAFLATSASGSGTHSSWTLSINKWSMGSWSTSLPLTYLEDNRLYKVARSSGIAVNQTRFRLDLSALYPVNLAAFLSHNLSQSCYWRLRLLTIAPDTGVITVVQDSGKDYTWPVITVNGVDPWGLFPWGGRLLVGDSYQPPAIYVFRDQASTTSATQMTLATDQKIMTVASTTDLFVSQRLSIYRSSDWTTGLLGVITDISGLNVTIQVTDYEAAGVYNSGGGAAYIDWVVKGTKGDGDVKLYTARFIEIDFFDEANVDSYIEGGRLMVSSAWVPSINMQYPFAIQFVDDSRRSRSRGGQPFVDIVNKYRRQKLRFAGLERNEIFATIYEIQRIQGVGLPILVIPDPDDMVNLHRLTVYGSLAATGDIHLDVADLWAAEITIEEWVA